MSSADHRNESLCESSISSEVTIIDISSQGIENDQSLKIEEGKNLIQYQTVLEEDEEKKHWEQTLHKKSLADSKIMKFSFSFRRFWAFIGPGFLMSIAYLDPGNIAGDLDAGQSAGYRLMWILLTATCLGLFYQILAARLGIVTQRALARLCREQFPKSVRYILWVMTEIAIIGSDIQEVIGSSIAMNILFGIPIWAGAIITILDSLVFLFIHYFGVRKLEGFFALLISIMAVCFFINFILANPDVLDVLFGTFVPTIPSGTLPQALGLVGSVIMPHNFYLHSALVLSRKINSKNKSLVHEANIYNSIESGISLFISFLINFAVVGTFAYYHDLGVTDLNLRNADIALESSFGNGAKIIWGVGLLAAGQSSTMTGTYAGQFVMEGFLDIKLPVWKRVFVTRSIAILPALCVAFIQDFDQVDTWLNILQCIQLPFALIPLLKFTSNKKIMGQFANSRFTTYFACIIALFLCVVNGIGLIPSEGLWWQYLLLAVFLIGYITLMVIVIREPVSELQPLKDEELEEDNSRIVIQENSASTKSN